MRPAATDGALSPPPRLLTFHASGGPSFGHSLSRPVSFEWAVRSGPCHCGQSNCPHNASCAKAARVKANARVRYIFVMVVLRLAYRFGVWSLIAILVSGCDQTKIPSLAEYANLLAKHAKLRSFIDRRK